MGYEDMAMKCPSCANDLPTTPAELIAEYQSLENRMQNDARVFYRIIVALITGAFSFMAVYWGYVGSLDRWDNLELREKTNIVALAAMPLIFLWLALRMQKRLVTTGDIRVARAMQLEDELRFWSFRLFSSSYTPEEKYFEFLGKVLEDRKRKKQMKLKMTTNDYVREGRVFRESVVYGRRTSKFFGILMTIIAILMILWAIVALFLNYL